MKAEPKKTPAPERKDRPTFTEAAAFWALPLATLADLARIMGSSPQALGRLDWLPVVKIGGTTFVRPIEVAHRIRALKPETE